MRIHCLKHVPFEGPAGIEDWATLRGHGVTKTRLFDGDALPDPSSFDWLIIMGGPMSVHDEHQYPWLIGEKRFIEDSIASGKTLIGICLGAQLIAQVLGARVYRNAEKEIGWFPVELTHAGRQSRICGFLPPLIEVLHWHGETFDLPEGAVHLARSAACEHQAFLFQDHVLGLQCHLESTPATVGDIVTECADEIVPATYVQAAERILAADAADYRRINEALFGILDRLAD